MMNIVALCLVVTSLATAGVLSPSVNTERKNNYDEVVVAKGLKVIVVEYEREGTGKTKVSISPQPEDEPDHATVADRIHNIEIEDGTGSADDKEKVVEEEEASSNKANARELICDTFGKCKHKIVGAFSKAKEKVAEKAHEVEEEVKEAVGDPFDKGKEMVSRKAQEKKECDEETCNKAKGALKTAIDTGKTLEGDVRRNVSEDLDIARRHVANKAKGGLETAETTAEQVKGIWVRDKENKIKHLIRQVRHFAHDALTYVVAAVSSSIGSLLGVVHLLGFAMAYGMSVWITFVSSYVLATALPRQQFGMVQSKIYPLYFRAMAYSIGVALLGHLLSLRRNVFDSKAEIYQCYNLIASLLMVFANLVYLEPRATKVMFERMKVEKEEGRGGRDMSGFSREPTKSVPAGNAAATTTSTTELEAARSQIVELNERLRKLNSFSSTLNILTLMLLTWHLVYLGQRLHMSSCH